MNAIDVAVELYRELSRELNSQHFDSRNEEDESVELLRRALVAGVTKETFVSKMKSLKNAHVRDGAYDIKLSSAIRGYYWERTYEEEGVNIPAQRFILK